jgi:hypothetical protein
MKTSTEKVLSQFSPTELVDFNRDIGRLYESLSHSGEDSAAESLISFSGKYHSKLKKIAGYAS